MIYCVVPCDLAPKLHEPLRRHFAGDPSIEVIVERRAADRRTAAATAADRRQPTPARKPHPAGADRRAIRSATGRRVAERRALFVAVQAPELPRRARAFADRLLFVEPLESSGQRDEDLDTARLVTRIQAGDDDAFAAIYTRYFDRVYNYLRVLLNDPAGAEDAAQEVFTKVLAALPSYERRRQPFRAWLFTVVRNHALNELRKRSHVEITDPAEVDRRRALNGQHDDLSALDWVSDDDLMVFIERLPLVQRQVLLLRYMLDLTHSEIGAILNRNRDDVAMLQSRAQAFLRKRLTALGRGPAQRSRKPIRRYGKQAQVLRERRFALR